MILGYTSSKEIIAKVASDLNLQKGPRVADFLEWIAEAMDFIKVTDQFESYVKTVSIKNYRGLLPCNLKFIDKVVADNSSIGFSDAIGGEHINDSQDIRNNIEGNFTYTINHPYIISHHQREGKFTIFYHGIKIDENGYPMIPDMVEYKDAMVKYIVMRLKYAERFAGTLSLNDYLFFKDEWGRAADKARAMAIMPTPDMMASTGKRWIQLTPDITEFDKMLYDSGMFQLS